MMIEKLMERISADADLFEAEEEYFGDVLDALEAGDFEAAKDLAHDLIIMTDSPQLRLAALAVTMIADLGDDNLADKVLNLLRMPGANYFNMMKKENA